jgi:hypothetical protein
LKDGVTTKLEGGLFFVGSFFLVECVGDGIEVFPLTRGFVRETPSFRGVG